MAKINVNDVVKNILKKKNREALIAAKKDMKMLEEGVARLSEQQLNKINQELGWNPVKVLNSLKNSIKYRHNDRISLKYGAIKYIISNY